MEKKKNNKGIVVLLIVLVVLLSGLCVLLATDKINLKSNDADKNDLNGDNQIGSDDNDVQQNENNNILNDNEVDFDDRGNYIIIKELDKNQYFHAISFSVNDNGTYVLNGTIKKVYYFTQSELVNIVKDGSIKLGSEKKYNIKKNTDTENKELCEYAMFAQDNVSATPNLYICKSESDYSIREYYYDFTYIEDVGLDIQIILDKSTKCNINGDIMTLQDVAEKEPGWIRQGDDNEIDILKFIFENGKCTEIIIDTIM